MAQILLAKFVIAKMWTLLILRLKVIKDSKKATDKYKQTNKDNTNKEKISAINTLLRFIEVNYITNELN